MDNRNGKRRIRYVDAWRPVHKWNTGDIWEIIKKWKINPHPCYRIGWGRCSCAICIFSTAAQIATLRVIQPIQFNKVLNYEKLFGIPIHYRKRKGIYQNIFLDEFADSQSQFNQIDPNLIKLINARDFTEPIFVENWKYPIGSFADQTGPM